MGFWHAKKAKSHADDLNNRPPFVFKRDRVLVWRIWRSEIRKEVLISAYQLRSNRIRQLISDSAMSLMMMISQMEYTVTQPFTLKSWRFFIRVVNRTANIIVSEQINEK